MIELIVTVWGKDHTLRVYRKSKSVWVAIGDCSGAQFSVKGRTEGSSIKRWIDAARYKAPQASPCGGEGQQPQASD
jgi:hypothetical protein